MSATDYLDGVYQEDLMVGVDTGETNAPAGGTEAVTQVGVHSFAVGQKKYTQVWDPPSLATSGEQTSTTVAVPGAAIGDFVDVTFSIALQGLRLWGEVTAANVVTVYLSNLTGAPVNLGSGTLNVLVAKSR